VKPTRRSVLVAPALGCLSRAATNNPLAPAAPAEVRLLFGGDIMLSRYVGKLARQKRNPAWPLHEVAGLLASADIAFANLESPFSDTGPRSDTGMVFHAEPEMVRALVAAGIDVASTANNHALDCGPHGIQFTMDLLARNGILAAGSGATAQLAHQGVILARKSVGFGFLAYTFDQSNGIHPGIDDRVALMDAAAMRADVGNLLRRADVVIVSMHAGNEYQPAPNILQQRFARAAIDAGAALVIGHHPHVVQPVERYRNGLIFYSLGNLVFDQFQSPGAQRGWIADVRFTGRRLANWTVIPVDIVNTVARLHSLSEADS